MSKLMKNFPSVAWGLLLGLLEKRLPVGRATLWAPVPVNPSISLALSGFISIQSHNSFKSILILF